MENTLENKAKFFSQYFGQKCQLLSHDGGQYTAEIDGSIFTDSCFSDAALIAKPILYITDEDIDFIFETYNVPKVYYDKFREKMSPILSGDDMDEISENTYHPTVTLKIYDFLRSKGFAVPFNGVPLETLVEWGWMVLDGTAILPKQ